MASTYVLLSHTTLGSDVSSHTISSIPSSYPTLILYCAIRTGVAATQDGLRIRFNGDTASNYYYTSGGFVSTAANNSGGNTDGMWAKYSASGNTLATGTVGILDATIVNANSTSLVKTMFSSGAILNSAFSNCASMIHSNMWNNTSAAISSINIYAESGSNLLTNSTITLYGLSNT